MTDIASPFTYSPDLRQPSELNYMKPNGFRFMVQRLPTVSYFVQATSIPEITLGTATQATPLVNIPRPGDKLTFGALKIRFIIQEDLKNYLELYNWIVKLGFPESREQFADEFGEGLRKTDRLEVSDGSLLVLDSALKPSARFDFHDLFPTSLSGMEFDTAAGSEYMYATATFAYLMFNCTPIAAPSRG